MDQGRSFFQIRFVREEREKEYLDLGIVDN